MLNFLRQEQELINTFEPSVFIASKKLLEESNIWYRVKSMYTGYGNRAGGKISAIGENPEWSTQYQIYVKNKDYAYALHLWEKYKQQKKEKP